MTVEEKAYNYASKLVKNRLTANEVAAHYGRGYIEGQEDMKQLGWHPASELPVIPKGESTIRVIAMWKFSSMPIKALCGKHGWVTEGVKWWCYPPKED